MSLFSTRGMFAGGLRETQQKEIPIHGVSYMAMKKILDYIYTSEIELDLDCVQEVLIAAALVQVAPPPRLVVHRSAFAPADACPVVFTARDRRQLLL